MTLKELKEKASLSELILIQKVEKELRPTIVDEFTKKIRETVNSECGGLRCYAERDFRLRDEIRSFITSIENAIKTEY